MPELLHNMSVSGFLIHCDEGGMCGAHTTFCDILSHRILPFLGKSLEIAKPCVVIGHFA